MDHKKNTHKPLRSKGAAAKQNKCNARPYIPAARPQINPVWVEQMACWGEEGRQEPHILSRKAVRWMW